MKYLEDKIEIILKYYKEQLNEMLLNTLSISQTQHKITSDIYKLNGFVLNDSDYVFSVEGKKIIIELKNIYSVLDIKKILISIYSCGYYIAQYFVSKKLQKNKLIIDENRFFEEINDGKILIFKLICEPVNDNAIDVPNKIYHITNKLNEEKIMREGLNPSSGLKKSYHPHRNYFISEKKEINQMIKNFQYSDLFSDKHKNKKHNFHEKEIEYVVFEINTINLMSNGFNKKEYKICFYDDENSMGIYTYDLIPKEKIKLINDF